MSIFNARAFVSTFLVLLLLFLSSSIRFFCFRFFPWLFALNISICSLLHFINFSFRSITHNFRNFRFRLFFIYIIFFLSLKCFVTFALIMRSRIKWQKNENFHQSKSFKRKSFEFYQYVADNIFFLFVSQHIHDSVYFVLLYLVALVVNGRRKITFFSYKKAFKTFIFYFMKSILVYFF